MSSGGADNEKKSVALQEAGNKAMREMTDRVTVTVPVQLLSFYSHSAGIIRLYHKWFRASKH